MYDIHGERTAVLNNMATLEDAAECAKLAKNGYLAVCRTTGKVFGQADGDHGVKITDVSVCRAIRDGWGYGRWLKSLGFADVRTPGSVMRAKGVPDCDSQVATILGLAEMARLLHVTINLFSTSFRLRRGIGSLARWA